MKQIQGSGARALAATMFLIGSAAATACGGGSGLILPPDTTTSAGGGTSTSSEATSSGSGGAGGSAPTCLDAGVIADVITVKEAALCAVARYDASDKLGFSAPSWGAHGGPLTLQEGTAGAFDLVRWTPPSGATGALTKQGTTVDGMIPMGAFLGGQAVDLPFFGWTAVSWSGAFPDLLGSLLLIKGGAVDKSYAVNGAFATAGIGAMNGQGRLLLTGLSAVADPKAGANGLFAADTCGTAAMPGLLPGQDATCTAPITVATWGDSSGPVTVDHDGNAFAVASSFDGTQEARGFDAASIARGAAPTSGTTLFKIPGFGSSLAAITPTATASGIVAFQPFDAVTFVADDVLEQAYAVTGGKLAPIGKPQPLVHATVAGATMYAMTDAQDRLWIGIDTDAGATYVVLTRAP